MSDELHDAYRGTVTTTWQDGKVVRSVGGVGTMSTDLDTGESTAVVRRADGTFQRVDPVLFEKHYL